LKKRLIYTFFLLLVCACTARAQEGFEPPMTFEQIQAMLKAGVSGRDYRQQGLLWYHWAFYEERKHGDSDSAFQYMARSVERFRRSTDTLAYHRANADLADWMAQRGLVDEALTKQKEALDYIRLKGQTRLETSLLVRMSRHFMEKRDTAHALEYRRLFRERNELVRDTVLEITVLIEEVYRLQYQQRIRDAIQLSERTLNLARSIFNTSLQATALYNTGYLYEIDRDYPKALQNLLDAEKMDRGDDETRRRGIYKHLSSTYGALDSVQAAFRYAYMYGQLGDSILMRDHSASIQRILQYDADGKRRAMQILEQEKQDAQSKAEEQRFFIGLLALGLIGVLLTMFLLIRAYKNRLAKDRLIASQKEEINTRKIRELEDSLKIETMQSMLEGQESERQRIAHDLHDSLGGLLAAAKLQVENLPSGDPGSSLDKDLLKIKGLLDETIAETRHIARNLQPGTLLQFGLVKALQDLINRVKGKGAPEISFQHFGDFSDLSQHFALNFYRIVQELLQNCLKHAKATEILVQLTRTDHQIALIVEDDGVGFDPETVQKGMGTGNVARRVQFLKGDLSIQTAPGQGTSTLITVAVPTANLSAAEHIQGKP
jgi:signal transduction histidine kinase